LFATNTLVKALAAFALSAGCRLTTQLSFQKTLTHTGYMSVSVHRTLTLIHTSKGGGNMASNVVKKLQIELDGYAFSDLAGLIEEKVIEKIQELIEMECSELSNMGDDGNTELSLEDTDVSVTGDGLEATIYFNRESGKFASTGDVEDEVISRLQNQDIEVSFNFSLVI
jgi:hypothetical protein